MASRINAEEVFYPLSVFYRFEIPIERRFLVSLGINEELIDKLLDVGEIAEFEEKGKRRMLILHHASIAEIYFKAYQSYPDLGGKLRELDEYSLFLQYLKSRPANLLDVIMGLRMAFWYKKGGLTILEKMIKAHGLIIGSPTYFASISGKLKALFDRTLPLRRDNFKLKGKVGGAIAVGGSRNGGQECGFCSGQKEVVPIRGY